MISAFQAQGYKCFENLRIELSRMNVLCGVNGTGKSSLIQAILLAYLANQRAPVPLNGPLGLQLGQALDVVRGDSIRLTVETAESCASWRLSAAADNALALNVEQRPQYDAVPSQLRAGLVYLQAERIGPRDTLAMDSASEDEISVGSRGEFVAHVLDRFERRPVRSELCRPPAPPTFHKQVEAWLQMLVPDIELRVEVFPTLSATAVRLRRTGQATDWLRAQNIGFGVSYVLPIIVGALAAKPGSMMIVENPEAHLHPRGQSALAQFLGRVAMADVQVVVETHSDHVLNGLRLAAVSSHPLQAQSLAIRYFSFQKGHVHVEPINVTDLGGLTESPEGFFDQSEKDLAAILRARRRA